MWHLSRPKICTNCRRLCNYCILRIRYYLPRLCAILLLFFLSQRWTSLIKGSWNVVPDDGLGHNASLIAFEISKNSKIASTWHDCSLSTCE